MNHRFNHYFGRPQVPARAMGQQYFMPQGAQAHQVADPQTVQLHGHVQQLRASNLAQGAQIAQLTETVNRHQQTIRHLQNAVERKHREVGELQKTEAAIKKSNDEIMMTNADLHVQLHISQLNLKETSGKKDAEIGFLRGELAKWQRGYNDLRASFQPIANNTPSSSTAGNEATLSPESVPSLAPSVPDVVREEVVDAEDEVMEEAQEEVDEDEEDEEDVPAPVDGVFEDFQHALRYWRCHHRREVLPGRRLNLRCYLFNPNGRMVAPQKVKMARNQFTFYQNQRPVAQNNTPWEKVPVEERKVWKEMWKVMRDQQNEQRKVGLIKFEKTPIVKGELEWGYL